MSKKTAYKPFPGVVCQRIRNLNQLISEVGERRKAAFEARDAALSNKHECGEAETTKLARFAQDHSDAIELIDTLEKQQKWLRSELSKTIKQADQDELFDSADVTLPLFTEKDQADEDDRPVGEARVESPDPETDGARANARMDEEDAEDFEPGCWEIQTSGQRGRGKVFDIAGVEEMEQQIETALGEVEGDIDWETRGGKGEVTVNGEVRLKLIRRGDFPAVDEAKTQGKAPAPAWRKNGKGAA